MLLEKFPNNTDAITGISTKFFLNNSATFITTPKNYYKIILITSNVITTIDTSLWSVQ